jgi:tetratricopeptide (TPR) repeat protein
MTIATKRDIVSSINENRLDEIKMPAVTFTAEVQGEFQESSFPTDRELTLKEGAQVVFIRNDVDRRWVNGTIGRVCYLSKERVRVALETGNEYDLEPEVWNNTVYKYDEEEKTVTEIVKGSFKQFPIKLAWALTIHKSQGLTFNKVNIDLGNGAFTGGQTYVALSRCTSLEGITMATPLRESDVTVNRTVVNFAAKFNDSGLITGALQAARADKAYAQAAHEFDAGKYADALQSFTEAVRARDELSNPIVQRAIVQKLYSLRSLRYKVAELEGELQRKQQLLDKLSAEFVALGAQCLDEGWDAEPAIANYDKALMLNPDNYDAKVGRARALVHAGRTDEAIDALALPALDPDRYEAAYELGNIFLTVGDLSNAFNFLNKAQKASPSTPEIQDALADAYEASGDEQQAAIHRKQARKLRKGKGKR